MNYVIIGNSAAAVGCIEGIRSVDQAGKITVITDENHHVYSRPLISYLIYGKTTEQRMKYRSDSFYQDNDVNLMLGTTVTKVDYENKKVIVDNGDPVPFDKLLFATGSSPFVPPMAGLDEVKEKFSFMKLDDAKALQAAITPESRVLIIGAAAALIVKLLLDLYLKTKSGLLLRAAGDNQQFVISTSRNPGMMKVIGLAIGNGCTALAGSILSQVSESANINAGTGMVVMGLASVIIGTSLFKKVRFMRATTMVIIGAILYRTCLVAAMQLGLPTNYLKLLMAVIFTVALVSNNFLTKGRRKQNAETPEFR
jgi:hypothetical protein